MGIDIVKVQTLRFNDQSGTAHALSLVSLSLTIEPLYRSPQFTDVILTQIDMVYVWLAPKSLPVQTIGASMTCGKPTGGSGRLCPQD